VQTVRPDASLRPATKPLDTRYSRCSRGLSLRSLLFAEMVRLARLARSLSAPWRWAPQSASAAARQSSWVRRWCTAVVRAWSVVPRPCCVLLGLVKQNRIHRVVSAHSGNFNLTISTTSSGLTLSSLVPTCCLLLLASRDRGF